MRSEEFEVAFAQEGERLDRLLGMIYPDYSRSFFQKLIREGFVLVSGKAQKASYPVKSEELVRVQIPDAVQSVIQPEDIPLIYSTRMRMCWW